MVWLGFGGVFRNAQEESEMSVALKRGLCPLRNRNCSYWYAKSASETEACQHPQKDSPKMFCRRKTL